MKRETCLLETSAKKKEIDNKLDFAIFGYFGGMRGSLLCFNALHDLSHKISIYFVFLKFDLILEKFRKTNTSSTSFILKNRSKTNHHMHHTS